MVIWDVVQQMQIRSMRNSQLMGDREGHVRDQRQEARADELEQRLQEVLLVTEALWTVCRDRLGMTDEDLRVAMQGVLEERTARANASPLRCTSCGAAVPRDMLRCQYCGADSGQAPELFR